MVASSSFEKLFMPVIPTSVICHYLPWVSGPLRPATRRASGHRRDLSSDGRLCRPLRRCDANDRWGSTFPVTSSFSGSGCAGRPTRRAGGPSRTPDGGPLALPREVPGNRPLLGRVSLTQNLPNSGADFQECSVGISEGPWAYAGGNLTHQTEGREQWAAHLDVETREKPIWLRWCAERRGG